MTAQDLKNAILQLAVQGKLVPQKPNDEPVSELLKRIEVEKAALIKAGRIKKYKTLTALSADDLPFDIPESWCWLKLGSICQLLDGEKKKGISYPYLEAKFLRGKAAATMINEGKYVTKGTRLILVDGENSGEVFFATEDGYMGSTFKVLFFPQELFAGYVLYFLQFKQLAFRNNKTGSAIPHLNKELFFNMPFPVPPLAEQVRIVAKIEELMPLVEEYGEAEERLTTLNTEFPDKLRKSILQQAIQGKLTERDPADEPASELLKRIRAEKERLIKEGKIKKEKPLSEIAETEIPFEIPETWAWVRIGDLFEVNPRNSVSDDTEVGFIPMPLLEPGYVNKHTYEKRLWKNIKNNFTHFQNGDIVFAKITPCFQNRKSAIICDLPNGYGAGTTELHVLRSYSGLVLNEYALWFVKNERFIVDGVEHFTGSVGQQRVGTDYIKQYPFPLPPLAEQQRIVDRVNELLAVCEELKL